MSFCGAVLPLQSTHLPPSAAAAAAASSAATSQLLPTIYELSSQTQPRPMATKVDALIVQEGTKPRSSSVGDVGATMPNSPHKTHKSPLATAEKKVIYILAS